MMIGLAQAPVAACSSIVLPEGYTGNVACDPTDGGVNDLSNPISAGETDTEPLLPCDSYTVPPGFQGSIACDSGDGSQVQVASPEVEATASVTSASADTEATTSTSDSASSSLGLFVMLAIGAYFVFGGAK